MSIRWMTRVWDDATDVEGSALLVLLCIADHAQDDTGSAYPSVGRLAHRSRRSERVVQRALDELEEKGWIIREMRPGRSTIYHLRTPDADDTPDKKSPPSPTTPHPRRPRHPTPVVDVTHNHKGTLNEPGGAVSEVPTEQHHHDDDDDDVTPEGHVTPGVTEFPWWARQHPLMQDASLEMQNEWLQAWATVCSLEDTQWTATEHLTHYLARMKEMKRTPKPDEWVRWFLQDEQESKRALRIAREKAETVTRPTNPDWQ